MHYVNMTTGLDELVGAMSVKGFFYGALAMLIGSVVCTIFYSFHRLRILICTITAFAAGTYYLIMMYYAIRLSQEYFFNSISQLDSPASGCGISNDALDSQRYSSQAHRCRARRR